MCSFRKDAFHERFHFICVRFSWEAAIVLAMCSSVSIFGTLRAGILRSLNLRWFRKNIGFTLRLKNWSKELERIFPPKNEAYFEVMLRRIIWMQLNGDIIVNSKKGLGAWVQCRRVIIRGMKMKCQYFVTVGLTDILNACTECDRCCKPLHVLIYSLIEA
jgi:hypothetical protein